MIALFKPLLLQSFRTGGLYLLLIALSLAIAVTTALKFSNDQIKQAITLQAAEMLAADLVLTNNSTISKHWKNLATKHHLQQSEVTLFSSMARTNDQFVMVNVKAVDDQFPLRGQLKIDTARSEPVSEKSSTEKDLNQSTQQTQAKAHLASGDIWLSQRAMDLLKVKVGESVFIADGAFKVAGVIAYDPNQELGFSGFSPTVIIHQHDIARTNAIQVGSRIQYRLLLAGAEENVKAYEGIFKQFERQKLASGDTEQDSENTLKMRTAVQGNNQLIKPIENLDTFLQLANILTILLCGIAIALTSQRYVQQNQDHIALLRCLGARKSQIFIAYVGLLAVVSVAAIVIGVLFGSLLGYGLLSLMLQLLPQLTISFSFWSFLIGPFPIAVFTSIVVLVGFIFPSILQLLNTPPIRIIRQQQRSKKSWLIMLFSGLISLSIFSIVLSGNIILSAIILASISVLCGILYSLTWFILVLIKKQKNRFSAYVRTPSNTSLQISALALGLSLITVLSVLRVDLLQRWQAELPEHTPNQFVYGLPSFEVSDFKEQLNQHDWTSTPLYPNIRGRLIEKNHLPFNAELISKNNALRRELNLTQATAFPDNNQIVQGEPSFTQAQQVSVENKLAQELGIRVGDYLTFSLPEGPLTAKVINLRSVEWESFSPNFFFIFSPDSLDQNAGSYLGSFYVPPQDKPELIELIEQFPSTVFIDVSLILEEIKRLVSVLVSVMTILAVLVGVAGVLVLIACLNLLMDERRREVALMRALGIAKQKLKNQLSLEVGFIGFGAGLMACLFSEVISALVSYRLNIPLQFHIEIWLILPVVMMIVCAIIGRYRLSYLCDIPPLKSLREMNSSS